MDPYQPAFDPYSPTSAAGSSASNGSRSNRTAASSSSSSSSSSASDSSEVLKRRILDLALSKVPSLGWTEEALRSAISSLGLSSSLLSLFPQPQLDLIAHFHNAATAASLAALTALQSPPAPPLNNSQLLSNAVTLQLQQHWPYAAQLPVLLGLCLSPQHLASSSSLLVDWADRVWYQLGDSSTDLHWYGKRAAVMAVYSSALLHACSDGSQGWRDTENFVQRRIAEAESWQTRPEELSRAAELYGGMAWNAVMSMLSQTQQQRQQQQGKQ